METGAVWIKVDEAKLAEKLQEVCTGLSDAGGEMVLDLSAVRRIDTDGLRKMELLARTASEKNQKVALRGVDVSVYKVLKLANLTGRFSFQN